MDWYNLIYTACIGIILFLAGYEHGRRTGGRCANTSTNNQSDAIAALITELEGGINNTPAINLVLIALNRLRQLTHV